MEHGGLQQAHVVPHDHDGLAAEVAQMVEAADVDAPAAAFDQADVAGGIHDLFLLPEPAVRGGVAALEERPEIALIEIPSAVKPEVEREGAAVGLGRIVTVHAVEEIIRHFETVCVVNVWTRGVPPEAVPGKDAKLLQ